MLQFRFSDLVGTVEKCIGEVRVARHYFLKDTIKPFCAHAKCSTARLVTVAVDASKEKVAVSKDYLATRFNRRAKCLGQHTYRVILPHTVSLKEPQNALTGKERHKLHVTLFIAPCLSQF